MISLSPSLSPSLSILLPSHTLIHSFSFSPTPLSLSSFLADSYLSPFLSLYFFLCLSLSAYLCPRLRLSVCLSLSFFLPILLSTSYEFLPLFPLLLVRLSLISLPLSLSLSVSVCLFVSLFAFPSF